MTDPRSAEAAALNIGLSTGAMYSGDLAEMRARADEALAAATACGSRSQAVSAAALGAMAESQTVSADVLPALDRAIALVDALTDEELACNLEAAENLTFAATLAGRYEIAGRHGQRGIDVARRTGKGHYLQELLYGKAVVLTRVGPLDQAREVAESLLEMVRLTSSARSLAWALELECRVATARGEIPDAVAAGDEALRLARAAGSALDDRDDRFDARDGVARGGRAGTLSRRAARDERWPELAPAPSRDPMPRVRGARGRRALTRRDRRRRGLG